MKATRVGKTAILFDTGATTVLVGTDVCEDLHTSCDYVLMRNENDCASVAHLLTESTRVLAPRRLYGTLSAGAAKNLVMFNAHSVWSEGALTIYAVRAEHPDASAIGYILDDGEKTYYISGSTLYNYDVIDDVCELVEDGVDYAFLTVGGCDSMNAHDAADLAYEIGAAKAAALGCTVGTDEFDFDDVFDMPLGEQIEL